MTEAEANQLASSESFSTPKDLNWDKIITDWQRSGLSQTEFCNRHHYHFNSFTYQRGKYLKRQKSTPISFSELKPTASSGDLSMRHVIKIKLRSGAVMQISDDIVTLKKVLSVLGDV